MTKDWKEALAEDCEDYLLHRYIPLPSFNNDDIIEKAIKEGYILEKFDRFIHKSKNKLT